MMSPPPLRGLDGCLQGQEDKKGFLLSLFNLIFFPGLDQNIIARLVQVNGKVKWRSLS
jgi:hypothetical protein